MDIVFINLSFTVLKYLFFLSSVCVLLNVQTIYSVFCLILAFIFAAGLMIIGGAVFVGSVSIVVYVGSVPIFFLFVIMMLDLRVESKFSFINFSVICFFSTCLLLSDLSRIFNAVEVPIEFEFLHSLYSQPNIVVIGYILYTWYAVPLILCALILLVAMIGTIVLLLEVSPQGLGSVFNHFTRSQDLGSQVTTNDFAVMELHTATIHYSRDFFRLFYFNVNTYYTYSRIYTYSDTCYSNLLGCCSTDYAECVCSILIVGLSHGEKL